MRRCVYALKPLIIFTAGFLGLAVSLHAQSFSVDRQQIAFGDQPIDVASAPQSVLVSNAGPTLTIGAALLTGPDAASFQVTNGCYMQQLPTAGSCQIRVSFSPLHSGAHFAELQLGDISTNCIWDGHHSQPLSACVNDRHIIPISGNGTGAPLTYAVPHYQVTVLDNNLPPGFQVAAITGFNNRDHFTGTMISTHAERGLDGEYCDDIFAPILDAFLFAGGQYIDLASLPDSDIGQVDGGTGCKMTSSAAGLDDSDDVYGAGQAPPNTLTLAFSYDGTTPRLMQQFITDGSTNPVVPIEVLSNGLVILSDNSYLDYLENGTVTRVPTQTYLSSFLDLVSRSWTTTLPFGSISGAVTNLNGIAPGWSLSFDTPEPDSNQPSLVNAGVITQIGDQICTPDQPLPCVSRGVIYSVNSAGEAVGGGDCHNFPIFHYDRHSGPVALGTLLPVGWVMDGCLSGGTFDSAFINDAGHIITGARNSNGVDHLVLLTPVVSMPVGNNVVAQSGSTTLKFTSVTSTGTTTVTPIDPSTAGSVAGGFALSNTVAYQISSTATFSGAVTIGFVVPGALSQTDFNALRIYHNENGTLTDITSGYDYAHLTIYGTTTSFSPFYLGTVAKHLALLTNTKNAFKSGSTIPIKVQFMNAANTNLSSAALPLKVRGLLRLQDSTEVTAVDAGDSNPDFDFRYDSSLGGTGGYIFNLGTKGLASGKYSLSTYVGSDRQFVYSIAFDVK